ncbi:Protein shisa-6-like protein isoform X1 [Aix galericulata]|nr:Protein shisa-6-like protein isoform X1 [Aix galericulata]
MVRLWAGGGRGRAGLPGARRALTLSPSLAAPRRSSAGPRGRPAMGPRHLLPPLLLLLLALQLPAPPPAAQAAGPPRAKGNRTQGAAAPRRTPRPGKELLNQTLAGPAAAAPTALPGRGKGRTPPGGGGGGGGSAPAHETCWGYYDVSGQWDKEFECNNSQTGFRYCCGTCFYRFCCNKRAEKLNQSLCRNYKSPEWAHPTTASGALPADGSNGADGDADKYDPDKDSTNATVYISCGAIAFVLIAGVFAKVAYDKARRPPREMNIHSTTTTGLRGRSWGPQPHRSHPVGLRSRTPGAAREKLRKRAGSCSASFHQVSFAGQPQGY